MDIEIVYADDWQGLYANGKLIDQGHRIEFYSVIKLINKNLKTMNLKYGIVFTERWCDEDWLGEVGDLPDTLDEVKFEDCSELF